MPSLKNEQRQQRHRKLILIISVSLVALLTIIYLLISLYFRSHFFFRTEINGLQVGGMTVSEAEDKIAADVGDYLLTIYDRDGGKYHIMGRDIDCIYVPDGSMKLAVEQQNMFGWFPALFRTNVVDVDTPMIYDEKKLEDAVAALPCFREENIITPVDATLRKGETAFEIVPEQLGNQMIMDKVVDVVRAAVTEGEGNITLTDDVYMAPQLFSDSPRILEALERAEACVNAEITYEIADYDEKLDSSMIYDMLQMEEDFSVILKEEAITGFAQYLATKYNTYADVREFQTSSGDTVQIGGGDYGWVINKEKEAELISENILSGEAVSREPVYSQRAKVEGFDDIGNTYVEIDYTKQHIWYYEEGNLILESDIVSGNISRGNGSPDGIFKIVYKQRDTVLRGEDYESEVEYFMPFAYNVGFHDASWRTKFGGQYYKTSGSHGCINLPRNMAEALYEHVDVDTPVIAYYRETVVLTAENCKISNAYSYVDPEKQ